MWVRMISTAAGPKLPHALFSGHVYELDDELAQSFIHARAAEHAHAPRGADRTAEVAAVDDGEKAVNPDANKKSQSLMDQLTGSEGEADEENDSEADAADKKNGKKSAAKK